MRTFVLGDIHGAYKALKQVLERSGFDYREDRLIALGDVCDGWPEVRQSVDELLRIKNLKYVIGNHDVWALDWALTGKKPEIWTSQGGTETLFSYNYDAMPKEHVDLFKKALPYLVEDNRLFVHGGLDPDQPIKAQSLETLVWDRDFLKMAREVNAWEPGFRYGNYDAIFLGHTSTLNFGSLLPLKFGNVWMIDTGAGWSGRLTIMEIATEKYWQSDSVPMLYPSARGRTA